MKLLVFTWRPALQLGYGHMRDHAIITVRNLDGIMGLKSLKPIKGLRVGAQASMVQEYSPSQGSDVKHHLS